MKKQTAKKNFSVSSGTIAFATCFVYIASLGIYLLQIYIAIAIQMLYPQSGEYLRKGFEELTQPVFFDLVQMYHYLGMISSIFLLLIAGIYFYAGWFIVKKSTNKIWYHAAIPPLVVLLAGIIPQLFGLKNNLIIDLLRGPYNILWTPYLMILFFLSAIAGGLYAKHVTLKIK